MIKPCDAFDVQTTLARITRLRVDTRQLDSLEVQYVIGFKWLLTLDEDEFDQLSRETESDYQFKEAFNEVKKTCLTFPDFLRSR